MKKRFLISFIVALLIGIFASCGKATKLIDVNEYIAMGEKYLTEMKYEEAYTYFLEVIEVEPMNVRAYLGITDAQIHLGKKKESVEVLNKGYELTGNENLLDIAVAIDKLDMEGYRALVKVYIKEGLIEKAEELSKRIYEETGEQILELEKNTRANKVAFGINHTLEIDENGNLWAWGFNENGSIGNGTTTDNLIPVLIMDNVKSVYCYGYISYAITNDGNLWRWENGQLSPVMICENVKSVEYNIILKQDGVVYEYSNQELKKITDDAQKIVSNGFTHFVIKNDSTLWGWGSNSCGELGDGSNNSFEQIVKVLDDVEKVDINKGEITGIGVYVFICAVKNDASLWGWGTDVFYEFDENSHELKIITPRKLMDDVEMVSKSLILKNDGEAYYLGRDNELVIDETIYITYIGYRGNFFAIKEDGSLWSWGNNDISIGREGTTFVPTKILDNVNSVFGDGAFMYALKEDGSLWGWGKWLDNKGKTHTEITPIKLNDEGMIYLWAYENNKKAEFDDIDVKEFYFNDIEIGDRFGNGFVVGKSITTMVLGL